MPEPVAAAADATPTRPHRHSRTVRKKKNPHLMLKLFAGWALVLALIVMGARKMWGDPNENRKPAAAATDDGAGTSAADQALLAKAVPACGAALGGFLAAGGPEQQNQFVLRPVETIARMTRFYALNPLPKIDAATLEPGENAIFRIGETPVVEMNFDTASGETIDVAFHEVDGEWRIDWEAYARYSEYPFALFLAGSGPDEAEFRLLGRERLAREREGEETISLIFYAPRFGKPGDVGAPSPEFLLPRDSDDGRMLEAALSAAAEGRRPFGSALDPGDPDDMIRVRLRLRRTDVEGERKFELVKVQACHWYASDLPGLDLPSPAAEAE